MRNLPHTLDGPPDIKLLKAGRGFHPDIWLTRFEGEPAIVKDYGRRPIWVRWTLGRWVTRREYCAYRLLQGIEGIPRLYGRIGPYGIALEYLGESRASACRPQQLPLGFFERLSTLVDAIHARGVAHGDLKRQTNILVTPHLEPYLIDFGASFVRGAPWNVVNRWIFHQLCRIDRNGIAKLKRRIAPEWLTPEEQQSLTHPPLLERVGRRALKRKRRR
jgi:hypothetical protein